jgi:hypothetical protein
MKKDTGPRFKISTWIQFAREQINYELSEETTCDVIFWRVIPVPKKKLNEHEHEFACYIPY